MIMSTSRSVAPLSTSFALAMRSLASGARKLACPCQVGPVSRSRAPAGGYALTAFFPGLKPEDMPDGEAWALERINLTTHNGTTSMRRFTFIPPWMAGSGR